MEEQLNPYEDLQEVYLSEVHRFDEKIGYEFNLTQLQYKGYWREKRNKLTSKLMNHVSKEKSI